MKLKQIWILFCSLVIMLSTFFSIYIPLMGGNFYLFKLLYVEDVGVALFVLTVLAFGFVWIALFVAGHILKWVVDLYNWEIEYKNLKLLLLILTVLQTRCFFHGVFFISTGVC